MKKTTLSKYHYLEGLIRSEPGLHSHIKLYEQSDITADEFTRVNEYLTTGDFAPSLIERGNDQIEGVVLDEDKVAAAETISIVYITASMLQLEDLQSLCVRKLQAMQPLGMQALRVAMMCEERAQQGDAKSELRQWLLHCVAERFFVFWETEYIMMRGLMKNYGGFREDVLAMLPSPKYKELRRQEMD